MTEGPGPDGLGQEPGNDGQPTGWPPPPGYGQPGGYGTPPPGYGTPPGYGQQPGYGGYGGQYGGGGPYGTGAPYGGPGGGYGKPWAPKPGIIPLRPLSLGDMLGAAFSTLKWNPKTILVPSAVVATVSGVLLAVGVFFLERILLAHVSLPAAGQPLTTEQVKHFLVPFLTFAAIFAVATAIVAFVTTAILTGVLTVAVGQGVLGKKETLDSVLQATMTRIWSLLATMVLSGAIIGFGWLAASGLSVGLALLLADGAHLVGIGILVGVLGVLTATVFAVIIGVRWSLALPIVMLERLRPLASLGRSWRLVRGSAWRVFGITLVTNIIFGMVALAIRTPFDLVGGSQLHPTIANMLASGAGDVIASTLTTPLTAAIAVLLYADLRMRKEGMAAALQAAAAAPPAAGGATAPSPW
ncbi:MAG TPA: glycerophosphoryl diester phosphodiesterase membrane domain-containing protein [Trebonia sp.]